MLWKIPVNFLSIETSYKGYSAVFKNKSQPKIADTNSIVFAFVPQPFEMVDLLKSPGSLNLFDDVFDAVQ